MTRLDALVVADFGNEILQELADKRDAAEKDWWAILEIALPWGEAELKRQWNELERLIKAGTLRIPWSQAPEPISAISRLPFTDIGDDQEMGENDKGG